MMNGRESIMNIFKDNRIILNHCKTLTNDFEIFKMHNFSFKQQIRPHFSVLNSVAKASATHLYGLNVKQASSNV